MEDLGKVIKRDSELRFSCSDIAGLAGYHPYAEVIDLVNKYLYQGLSLLQDYDYKRLHITMVTKEEEALSLIKKLDSAKQRKFEEIEQITMQSYNQNIAKALIKEAIDLLGTKDVKDKLSADELDFLQREMLSKISTRYGVHCEDDALDKYESITGYEVKERNDSYYIMEVPTIVIDLNNNAEPVRLKINDITLRRVMTAGNSRYRQEKPNAQSSSLHSLTAAATDEDNSAIDQQNNSIETLAPPAPGNNAFLIMNDAMKRQSSSNFGTLSKPKRAKCGQRPAFTLIGKVDGVSEQLDQASEDPTLWTPTRVIVEAKSRVHSIKHPPPLYEQIQLVSYMIMTGSKYGDLVQSVSRRKVKAKRCEEVIVIDEDSNETAVSHTVTKQTEEAEEEQFHISRITLNDTPYYHQHHWETVIMPRLHVFRDAIVSMRQDDDLRARYLCGEEEEKKYLIFELCPYFK